MFSRKMTTSRRSGCFMGRGRRKIMDGADAGVEVELHAEATLIERMPR